MVFCQKCDIENPNYAKFCYNCGNQLKKEINTKPKTQADLKIEHGKLTGHNIEFVNALKDKELVSFTHWNKSEWIQLLSEKGITIPPGETAESYAESIIINEILSKNLSFIIKDIRNKKGQDVNESSTTCLINGILYTNGWNVFDPNEVMPQDRDYAGKRPDLTLKIYGNKNAFIEIKKIGENLNKHVKQLKGYFRNNKDVKYGFLTNARFWWFYTSYLSENNDLEIVREAEVDLIDESDSNIENFFSEYLNKDKLVDKCYEDYLNKLSSNNLDKFQKMEIMSILCSRKDKRLIEPLKQIFLNEEEHEWLRQDALVGLVNLCYEKDSKPILEKALNDESKRIRGVAKDQIRKLGP